MPRRLVGGYLTGRRDLPREYCAKGDKCSWGELGQPRTGLALAFSCVRRMFAEVKCCAKSGIAGLVLLLAQAHAFAERINQEGRILGPAPVVTNAVLFNTAQSDAITSAMQIFPVTNPWNEDISKRPVLPNSDAMIAQIISDLASNNRTLRAFYEMNFVLVPDNQPLVPITFVTYPGDSDPGPYPIPSNMPIEGWPNSVTNTLVDWQMDTYHIGGDRHSIIVQPDAGFTYETWQAKLTNGNWLAGNGAIFNLNSNGQRTLGYTSGDAAGLSMFPALPRYDECQRGMVEHACRIVVAHSRKEYIYPASHYASSTPATQTNVPAMGQRVRLKSSFVIPPTWGIEEQALLRGLKKYGALVADNGSFFSISVTPDDRWSGSAFSHIRTIGITNFEVIQTTGTNEGPRSPGAPVASAGPDARAAPGAPATLQGFVTWGGPQPTVQWKLYSGPGTVAFGNAALTNTTATFSTNGTYTLMLSADDGIHAVAYDAVVYTVASNIIFTIAKSGTNVVLNWIGGSPPFVIEKSDVMPAVSWTPVMTNSGFSTTLPISSKNRFFRLRAK